VFVPLVHHPGEAQVDFGHALVRIGGRLVKAPFFVMSLPYSDAFYVQVFARECTETFLEGHVRAFAFFGAVPRRISYDNSKIAVSQIVGTRGRRLTQAFLRLRSHHLFESHFCRVARGNEKGVVESMVRYSRSNFLIPAPEVPSLDELGELNARLEHSCRAELERTLRGKPGRKRDLLAEDVAAMLPLPAGRFEACKTTSARSTSLSLVRFECNDYSVPVCDAHQQVTVKGYADRVEIYEGTRKLARHRRCWGRELIVFDPVHYLSLLEKKPGALDYALPLSQWELPECFGTLRRRLENDRGSAGTREYIQVLRLLERHTLVSLSRAVNRALDHGATSRDAIAQHLYDHERPEVSTFRLDGREHLKGVRVDTPCVADYATLLERQVAL
jgi:hypothetical protein